MQAVLLCETSDAVVLVFPDAFGEVGGDSGVERSVAPTCENVDGWLSLVHGIFLDSRFRGNDNTYLWTCSRNLSGFPLSLRPT